MINFLLLGISILIAFALAFIMVRIVEFFELLTRGAKK